MLKIDVVLWYQKKIVQAEWYLISTRLGLAMKVEA